MLKKKIPPKGKGDCPPVKEGMGKSKEKPSFGKLEKKVANGDEKCR